MSEFHVATFFEEGKDVEILKSYSAYTLWYNPVWKGCMVFKVKTMTGREAKRQAILLRRAHEIRKRAAVEPKEREG